MNLIAEVYAMGPAPQAEGYSGGGLIAFLPLLLIFVVFLLIYRWSKKNKPPKPENKAFEPSEGSHSRYKTTISIGKFIELIGWFVVMIAGLIALIMGLDKGLWALLALGIGIGGILIVYTGQLILIFVDIENNTRQTREESRSTNELLSKILDNKQNK